MVEELPLHDATFDGLVMQGRVCRMFFSRSDGSGCEVLLAGVDALQMDDFLEGNIVVYFGTTTREHAGKLSKLARLYTPRTRAQRQTIMRRMLDCLTGRLMPLSKAT